MCFVNTALQLLNSIPDFKSFFASRGYRQHFSGKLPISDELCRIFQTDGGFVTPAAVLRQLVGVSSQKHYLYDGSQQDTQEFHLTLLDALQSELTDIHFNLEALRLIERFKGKECRTKKFLSTKEGFCKDCKMVPRTED